MIRRASAGGQDGRHARRRLDDRDDRARSAPRSRCWRTSASPLLYNSLVDLDADLTPVPALAESWETPDNLTYIFHLRPGIKFHSGREMDSEDVKYALRAHPRRSDRGLGAWLLTVISAIETPDAATVKLT